MPTYSEIAYDILETVSGNYIGDDEDISIPQIMYQVRLQRALWIRNEYNKPGRKIDPQIEQDLGCLLLEEVDSADCCEIESGCIVLRTVAKIPELIEFHDKSGITRIGPVSKVKIPFNFVSYQEAAFSSYAKYTKGVFAYLLNDHIYLAITDPRYNYIDYINVRGVFANPEDLQEFKCDDDACFTYDTNYPINSWMIPYIKEQVLKQLGISLQIPKDSVNDASDSIKTK